jgi:hypothetical protein
VRTYLFLIAITVASAQSSTTYSGGGVVTSKDGVVTDLRQSINGREVPLEQVERKVISKSGNTTVTEQTVRHYGPNGQVVSVERVLQETTTAANGDSTVKSTTYRSDVSGNMAPAERRTVETHKNGSSSVTETQVEKPSVNGSFDVAEKRTLNSQTTPDGKKEDETVYLRDTNGRLYTAQRSATVETKKGNETVSNTAIYEAGVNGDLSLARQKVAKTVVKADGSITEETELFGRASDGRARDASAGPQLTEKRVIETQKASDGAVVKRESVQLPSVNDPNRLTAPREVSETVCRGECGKP